MKWSEMTTGKRVLFVIGLVCGIVYLVLTALSIFDINPVPGAVTAALFACFWLINGILQKNKKIAVCHYILAGLWLVIAILDIF